MRPPRSRTRVLPLLALLGLLPPLAASAAAQSAAQSAAREVEHVRLAGVRGLPKDLVEGALETQETHCKSLFLAPFCALDLGWAQRRAALDPAAVARDTGTIHRLYADWGYPDAHATAQVTPEGAREATVTFHVTEGTPTLVRSLRVVGLAGTGVSAAGLPLRVGQPYAGALLDVSQGLLLGRLGDAGRPFATVEVSGDVAAATHRADVVLAVTPGPVGVFGTTTVDVRPPLSPDVVRRRIAWREGQRFDPAALARTQERLRRVPVIDTARVVPARAGSLPGDSAVNVTVTATPGRISAIQGAGSMSSSSCLSGQVYWSDRYIGGKPRVVTIGAGASNLLVSSLGGFPCTSAGTGAFADPDYFVRGDWREPVGADTWLLFSADYSRLTAPRAYIQRGVEGRIGLDRDLRPGVDLTASYAPSRLESTAGGPFFCALFGVCAGSRLDQLQSFTTLAPLSLDLTWAPPAHARRTLGPQTGPLAAAAVAVGPRWLYSGSVSVAGAAAPTLSAMHYARGDATGTITRLVGHRFELAARLRLGALDAFGDTLPPQVRLFGGGAYGVRGAPQNLLGPKFLVVDSAQAAALSCPVAAGACTGVTVTPDQALVRATGGDLLLETGLEARLWVSDVVQLAAFLDYGYVRSGAAANAPADIAPARGLLSPGVGIRLLTPVGPLRLDFAYDPTGTVTYPLLAQLPAGTFLNLGEVAYDPYGPRTGGAFTRFRRRIQLQFSLGQPF